MPELPPVVAKEYRPRTRAEATAMPERYAPAAWSDGYAVVRQIWARSLRKPSLVLGLALAGIAFACAFVVFVGPSFLAIRDEIGMWFSGWLVVTAPPGVAMTVIALANRSEGTLTVWFERRPSPAGFEVGG